MTTPESFPQSLGRLTRTASDAQLWIVLGTAVASIVIIATSDFKRWPVIGVAGAFAALALWGLIQHRIASHNSRGLATTAVILAVLGGMLAFIGGFGLLFWMLGPRWNL